MSYLVVNSFGRIKLHKPALTASQNGVFEIHVCDFVEVSRSCVDEYFNQRLDHTKNTN